MIRKKSKEYGKKIYFIKYKGEEMKKLGKFSSKWLCRETIKKVTKKFKEERKYYEVGRYE